MALCFLADEHFRGQIVRGLLRRDPGLDIVRAQDVGLTAAQDPVVLEWTDQNNRIVLTNDVRTMPKYAYARLAAGQRVAGVCVVPQALSIGQAIDELLVVAYCSTLADWENQVRFIPL